MSKYIILVKFETGVINYIAGSSSRSISHLLDEAAPFRNRTNAEIAANQLRQLGFERKQKCELFLAPLMLMHGELEKLKTPKPKVGFVIERENGKFYTGPKTVAPRDFGDAHYKWGEIEAATFFPTREIAVTRVKQIHAVLKDTSVRMKDRVYTDITERFRGTVIAKGNP